MTFHVQPHRSGRCCYEKSYILQVSTVTESQNFNTNLNKGKICHKFALLKPLDSKCTELDGHASLLICYLADQLQPLSNVVANQAKFNFDATQPTGLQRDNWSRELPFHRVTSFSGCHVTVTEGATSPTSNQSSRVGGRGRSQVSGHR